MTWSHFIRRLILGPDDAEISVRSQAAGGGPPYPAPQHDAHTPTPLVRNSKYVSFADTARIADTGIPWAQVVTESEAVLQDAESRRAARPGPMFDPPADEYPTIGTPGTYQRRMKENTAVNDPTSLGEQLRATGTGSDAAVSQQPPRVYIDDILTAPDPVTDSGIHTADDRPQRTLTITCSTCKGLGRMERTVSELLRESIALIPADGGQAVITEFYRRLLTAAPDLAPLFPTDLITAAVDDTASPGRLQRDRLLQALAALADLYGTTPADRQRLTTALRAYGRSHAAFARPDGTTRGATVEEYLVVKQTLMDTLHTAAGTAWLPAYDTAWAEAYDFAMVVMLHEQMTGDMTFPRQPRTPLPH